MKDALLVILISTTLVKLRKGDDLKWYYLLFIIMMIATGIEFY